MSSSPPPIDQRSYEDIVQQTTNFVEQYTPWRKGSQPDAGEALIRIFGRMAKLVSDRLNRVPDKNFLAFLDLIGTQIAPPQPARVPLQFFLTTNSPTDAVVLVPAQTQVSAPPATGDAAEVVFETEQDLVMTNAQLQTVIVHQPDQDKFSDRSSLLNEIEPPAFAIFAGESAIEHSLYLACEEGFTLPGLKSIQLNITPAQPTNLQTTWSYWNGKNWESLFPNPVPFQTQSIEKTFQPPSSSQPTTINGITATWLRIQVAPPLPSEQTITNLPSIQQITATVQCKGENLAPDFCFFNTTPLDLKQGFYPFGEQPRFNDTFYIAHQDAFSMGSAEVDLAIEINSELPVNPNLSVAWEAWDGSRWSALVNANDNKITSYNFISSQSINNPLKLKLPQTVAPIEINGQKTYWIRARITQRRSYETDLSQSLIFTTLTKNASPNNQQLNVASTRGFVPGDKVQIGIETTGTYTVKSIDSKNQLTLESLTPLTTEQPVGSIVLLRDSQSGGVPRINSLKLSYGYTEPVIPLSACQTYNDFEFVDQTRHLQSKDFSFQPFTFSQEEQPALYLGFDRAFANQPVTLYAQVAEPKPEEVAPPPTPQAATQPPQVIWEYATDNDWKPLGVADGTNSFTQRGLIQFIGPTDLVARTEFGQTRFWLRARVERGTFRAPPRLHRLLLNTIWASQTLTLTNEILGSSNGNPNQQFQTNQAPVLPGQQLDVRELRVPISPDQADVRPLEEVAIVPLQTDPMQNELAWVRWQEVQDFYGSTAHDRHYVLDRLTGRIQFGDGQSGKVPALGQNNIRMTTYRTGGGKQGNQPANAITQLKTTIPYIDRVTHLEAATGAADQETLEQVQERGPKTLRHRWKAVTVQDFEDLAYEASSDVARVKVIMPSFNPLDGVWIDPSTGRRADAGNDSPNNSPADANGHITLLIVPNSSSHQPTPTIALLEQVAAFIRGHCTATLDLQVSGPKWQEITISVEVVPTSIDRASSLQAAIRQRLETFLHPLTGGTNGKGWMFGRYPQKSDLYRAIGSVPGLHHVRSLTFSSTLDQTTEDTLPKAIAEDTLIYSGAHQIHVVNEEVS